MSLHSTSFSRAVAAAIVASAALTTPALADFVGVSRCNAAGGTSPPVLHFVDGGNRFTVAVGENGLTRNIIFNERAALQWAAASGLFPEGTVFGNYSNYICGLPNEEGDDPVEEEEPEEPEQPEEPEEPEEPEQPEVCEDIAE